MSWHLHGGARFGRGLQSAGLIIVIATVMVLSQSSAARAADVCSNSWKAAVSGNWNTAADWSKNAVPTSADSVCITVAGTSPYTVTLDGSQGAVSVKALTVGPASGGGATLLMEGQGCTDDAYLNASGNVTTHALGTIQESNADGSCSQAQDVNLNWGGTFANAGKLTTLAGSAGGTRELGGTLTNTGTITIDTNTELTSSSTTLTNSGAVVVGLGAILSMDVGSQTWTQGTGGSITDSAGGYVRLSSSAIFNQGAGVSGQVVLENSSTLNMKGAGKGTFVFHDADTLTGNVAAGQSLVIQGVGCDRDSSLSAAAGTTGFTNAGSIDLTNVEGSCTQSQDASLNWAGTLANTGSITSDVGVSGGTRELSGNLTNTGSVTIHADTSFNGSTALFDNKKTVTVDNAATLTIPGGNTFNNDLGGSIATTAGGGLDFNNATFDVGAGSVGTTPVVLENSSTLNLKGAGAGTFDFRGPDTLSGNVGAAQSLVLQSVGCLTGTNVTAAAGFTNAGSIDLTNVRGGCADSQAAILSWSGNLTNSGTITSDVGVSGGDRELTGNLINTGSVVINADTSFSASSAVFDNKKSLTVANGATLTTAGGDTFVNDTGGSITTTNGSLDFVNTILTVGAGSVGTTPVVLENSSTLNVGGAAPGTFVFRGGGNTLNVPAHSIAAGQSLVIQGQCGVDGNASVTAPAGFTNAGSIDLTAVKGTCSNSQFAELFWSGTITNTGTISSDFGVAGGPRYLEGTLTNSGNLNINTNTLFDGGSNVLTNAGKVLLASGRKLTLPDTEVFKQTSTGTLEEQIASATSYGKLLVPSSTVTLGGTLQVDTLAGYTPPGGTKFPFITFTTRSGSFASTVFNSHSYQVKYDPTDVTLVALDATATTVSLSPASTPVNSSTSVTATVTGPGNPSPTGTVTFSSDGAGAFTPSTKTCTLAPTSTAGVSKCSVSYAPSALGSQTITASYPGDGAHLASSNTASLTVTTRTTTTTIACSPSPVALSAPSSCTATVKDTSPPTGSAPVGTVAFTSDGSGSFSASSCQLTASGSSGTCAVSYTPSAIGSGTHTITGSFTPDATDTVHASSSGTFGLKVSARTTSTTLTCLPNPVASGSATTCQATVSDISAGTKTAPTGSVGFSATGSGAFSAPNCSLANPTATSASCSLTYTPSASGAQTITAGYAGDATHLSSSKTFSLGVT